MGPGSGHWGICVGREMAMPMPPSLFCSAAGGNGLGIRDGAGSGLWRLGGGETSVGLSKSSSIIGNRVADGGAYWSLGNPA